ncbi:NAD(P)-dependent oxidoreductase [Noviherbaspirillum galbum]|uniref:NAD(P)-dependent oxidoreductase n=1 Tax=Noviherbaspirillum galbum TaxID=2709383 RepID=A0A6B3SP95_9BURK|nr:NAD(P)-dependent oxidoreductase [Noviherbaspirillum galbum]NEX61115.1 NAD(P)-dependent oxidoreductase [Noviherbaspirillum galbum]
MTGGHPRPAVAFLGIGLMGEPMARRIMQAGFSLSAWNRTKAKAEKLAADGATVAGSAMESVVEADIIITMLEAGPAVAQVLDMIESSLKPGSLVVDMSSTKQSEAQQRSAQLARRDVRFMDAPVSGGVVGAQAGTLAIMAGASPDDYRFAEDVLRAMGRPTLVGPVGCGQVAKLCNQLIVGGTLSIIAEALLLAGAAGANPAAMRAAIRGGFAESRILDVHGQRMLERNFLPGGQVKSQAKDLENIMDMASHADVTLPVTSLVRELFNGILHEYPNADQAAALLALERRNPGKRLGDAPDQLP